MRFIPLFLVCLAPAICSAQVQLSRGVQQIVDGNADPSAVYQVEVRMTPFDIRSLHRQLVMDGLSLDQRKKIVPSRLMAYSDSIQNVVVAQLEQQFPGQIEVTDQHWITNMMTILASVNQLRVLANLKDVRVLVLESEDLMLPADRPIPADGGLRSANGHEPGHDAINAPALWAMGYTGRNRLAFLIDTGVWPDEPALAGKFLGSSQPLAQSWFPYDSQTPLDKSNSHGTHCTGIMMGLDPATADTIGVAFNGHFIATDPVVQNLADVKPLTEFVYAFEWALDPDGDPLTVNDVPDVISNSWGHGTLFGGDSCGGPFADVLEAVHAAGIASVQSAGNDGPAASTIGIPSTMNFDLVNIFSVGSIQGAVVGYPISSFSSRGPTICGGLGALAIKPEVVAPGQNVRSCVKGTYDLYSGTSMAGPHVAGTVLLLKEAFPDVAGEEILFALYSTALDLGEVGEDNTFGNGLINAEAAFNYLVQFHTPATPITNAFNLTVESINLDAGNYICGTSTIATVTVRNTGTTALNGFNYSWTQNGTVLGTDVHAATIAPNGLVTINLPSINLPATGDVELYFEATPIEVVSEFDVYDNSAVKRFSVRPNVIAPFYEDFETNLPNGPLWTTYNPDYDLTWDTLRCGGLAWSNLSASMDHGHYSPRANQIDGLVSPEITIPLADSAALRFDYSYTFRHQSFADTMSLLTSTDCGQTWSPALWRKGGLELATHDSSGSFFLPVNAGHWDKIWIDMSAYMGQNVLLMFRSVNRQGNTLAIDNINLYIDAAPAGIAAVKPNELGIYPNPGRDVVHITGKMTNGTANVWFLDMMGRTVTQSQMVCTGSGTEQLIVPNALKAGRYTIRIASVTGIHHLPWTKL